MRSWTFEFMQYPTVTALLHMVAESSGRFCLRKSVSDQRSYIVCGKKLYTGIANVEMCLGLVSLLCRSEVCSLIY